MSWQPPSPSGPAASGPAPSGWQPSPGGQAPTGWQTSPGWHPGQHPPAPPPPPWYQRWWAATGAMLSVLLVGCVLGGVVAVLTDTGADGTEAADVALPPPVAPGPDPVEDPNRAAGDRLGPGERRTGSGPAIVSLDVPPDGLHTVTLTHDGERLFYARLLDTDGEFGRGLAVGSGEYAGTFPLQLRSYGDPGAIDISDADGTWTVSIQELSESPVWPEQTTGEGSTVLLMDPDQSVSTIVVSHQGQSNVFVWGHAEGQYEELMVNEIGDWSGEVELRPDTFALEIDADGTWSIEAA